MRHNIKVLHELKPAMLMVVVQVGVAGMHILYKLAANDGMNLRILLAYRCIFATAFIAPLALILERKSRPKLTWTVLSQAFLCGFFGILVAQNLYMEGLALTSATFVAAVANLIPAITLVLAIFFRLDKLALKTSIGKAKVLGILAGIGGAMLLTFYKGVEISIWSPNVDLLKHNHHHQNNHTGRSHILGSSLAIASSFCYALWLIIQTKMSKRYPCHYSITALVNIMGSIQCVTLSLCMDRNWSHWKLGWNIRLLTVAYVGIVNSGLVAVVVVWCVHVRGPVFVSSFGPLALVLVAIVGSLILEEKLHLGSIVGAVLIVCGLYMVLWGQSKEIKEKAQVVPTKGSLKSGLVKVVIDDHQQISNVSIDENSLPK